MNEYLNTGYANPGAYHQPTPPKKQAWWKKPLVWVPAVALVVGLGIGTGSASAKEVEVIKEVPVEKIVTKTETKNVEVTPAACEKYVDLSEQAFDYAAEAMGYMSDAMTAASKFDVAGITAASGKLDGVNPKMKALSAPMSAAKAECRSK